MTRFDETQSNHPQANTPWAGQTKANAERVRPWGKEPDRGAPLLVLLALLAIAGFWGMLSGLSVLPASTLLIGIALIVMILYRFAARGWTAALWRDRWADRSPRAAVPEAIVLLVSVGVLIPIVLFQHGQVPWLSVALFIVQLAALAVIAPITLRRYPGIR